jgi:hypothetical protein
LSSLVWRQAGLYVAGAGGWDSRVITAA